MIINALYEHYYSFKRKRGYEVIGWGWSLIFLALILCTAAIGIYLLMNGKWWLTIVFIFLYIILKIISRKTDVILEKSSIEDTPKAKSLILNFLQKNYKFENPISYNELAKQLQSKAEKNKVTFDLNPYINMTLPVFVLILSLIFQNSPETFQEIIVISLVVLIFSLSINPAVNIFSDIFLNSKYEKIMELSILVREIYLDELANECKINKELNENSQLIKVDMYFNN
ncbi:hypothetical protein [Planococcus halocryophilus]|uniref:hypothetical protein n=1 Tax=Planococcus halocryophilus TaxID=1215089 RepID=UPI001F10634E|nr:hypothetical protein [Planococcus halocryophilus]MCH4826387.1 hypothetical protein [Planococcus halocryophilus]